MAFGGRLFHGHGLEAALERGVRLDMLLVFGPSRGADEADPPRARAGLRIFAASSEPDDEPAPTMLWISSMKG